MLPQPINDLARLLPILFGVGRDPAKAAWRYPPGVPGVSEVFELYFAMLDAALERGGKLSPTATPLEQIDRLASTLPGAPVARITECFSAACYGQSPTSGEVLTELRAGLHDVLLAIQARES